MSKERLEKIEKHLDPLGYGMGGHFISVNDINWLVGYAKEHVERVQKLEQRNKRYREALEFYANEENYFFDEREYKVGLGVPESEITIDYGNKARKALEGESDA